MNAQAVSHPIAPVWDKGSKILILGSFPSVRSREVGFYYGHPQNRFWRVLAELLGTDVPSDIPAKRELLLSQGIALWDVIASCRIIGSADKDITAAVPNDISAILRGADIGAIFTNGRTAAALYKRHIQPQTGRHAIYLPSTSPANAAWSLSRLCESWSIILPYLK